MKKINIYILIGMVCSLLFSCNEEPFSDGGEGSIILRTAVSSNMNVITRAEENNLKQNLMVWISNSKGLVRRYDSLEEIPTSPISLISDHYVAEAWTGDSVPASFNKIYYKGTKEFDVTSNQTVTVNLTCSIANVAAQVLYDKNIDDVLKNYKMTIGHTGRDGKLVFEGREAEDSTGYFMMPSFDKNLSYELTGTQIDGTDFKFSGQLDSVKPRTKYILHVQCTEKTNEVGGLIFTIKIDEKEIESTPHETELILPPKIEGYGFDIKSAITGEEGSFDDVSVYISTASKLDEVDLESTVIKDLGFEYPDIDLIEMDEEYKEKLQKAGISGYATNSDDGMLYQIIFSSDMINKLENGNYSFLITAKDIDGRTSQATLKFLISEIPVLTTPISKDANDLKYGSITLSGKVIKDGTENVGFRYHKKGEVQWIYVEGQAKTRSLNSGDEFFTVLNDLENGATYEYKAVAGEIESSIEEFTMGTPIQLPNAGFEDWGMYQGKIRIPSLNYDDFFWDSGNHGAASVGIGSDDPNITYPDNQIKHSGEYSACLKTDYKFIKLAAGNIFIGKFLGVSGTNGVTGFGRPFIEKPKSVKLWVKYIPQTASNQGTGNYIKRGDKDQGQIFIALTDDSKEKYTPKNSSTEEWPIIVNTGTQTYFSDPKYHSRIIAYGEKIFTEATDGEDLIQIEIPIEYYKNDRPSNIIFVASSSRYGDYFEGVPGSTMWLDDIELVYED